MRSIQVSPSVMRREFPVNDDVSDRYDILKERKSKDMKKSTDSLLGGKERKFK